MSAQGGSEDQATARKPSGSLSRGSRTLLWITGVWVAILLVYGVSGWLGESKNEPWKQPNEYDPAVSRDGKWIAFGGGGIHVARIGAAATRITNPGKDVDAYPDWSPDGTRIVFARGRGNENNSFVAWTLYVVNRDGSGLRQLTQSRGFLGESAPSWSPDGNTIAFERRLDGGIYTIDVDGTNERLLVSDGFTPAWSPDGSRIAFQQDRIGPIAVFDLETQAVVRVIHGPVAIVGELGEMEDPAWSPDGTRIAFGGESHEIDVVKADGTGMRRLTHREGIDESPAWTPDGRIVFGRIPIGRGSMVLYVMNGDGTGVHRLVTRPDVKAG